MCTFLILFVGLRDIHMYTKSRWCITVFVTLSLKYGRIMDTCHTLYTDLHRRRKWELGGALKLNIKVIFPEICPTCRTKLHLRTVEYSKIGPKGRENPLSLPLGPSPRTTVLNNVHLPTVYVENSFLYQCIFAIWKRKHYCFVGGQSSFRFFFKLKYFYDIERILFCCIYIRSLYDDKPVIMFLHKV